MSRSFHHNRRLPHDWLPRNRRKRNNFLAIQPLRDNLDHIDRFTWWEVQREFLAAMGHEEYDEAEHYIIGCEFRASTPGLDLPLRNAILFYCKKARHDYLQAA